MKIFFGNIIKQRLLSVIVLVSLSINHVFAGTLLVTHVLSNSVTLFDENSLQPIKKLSVGFMPHEIAITPNGKFALISNFGTVVNIIPGDSVTLIDIENVKTVQTIKLPQKSRPHGITFISNTEALITVQGIQSLLLLDITTGKVIKTLALPGQGAHMVTVDAEYRYAYVANVDSGSVCKIDLKTFSVINEVTIGKEAEGLALTADQHLLLVTNRKDNYIAVIRTKDLLVLKKIHTNTGPVRVVLFDHEQKAAVANTVSGTVQIIDMATLAILHTYKTTSSFSLLPVPINIVVRDDQTTAYISNSFACNIALINLETGKVLKTIKASAMPDGLAISSIRSLGYEQINHRI